MQTPALPPDEIERLQALHALSVLDTPPEERFDRLVRLAQHLLDVPIALVSLVDTERQWFKACIGLDVSETSREISFCGHAILGKDIFCIPDALEDARFADNPLVTGAPHIRFYAGAPLTLANGHRIGTLCTIDTRPRTLTARQRLELRDLADIVEQQLDLQLLYDAERNLTRERTRFKLLFDSVADGIVITDQHGLVTDANPAIEKLFGYSAAETVGKPFNLLMTERAAGQYDSYLAQYQRLQVRGDEAVELEGLRKDHSTFAMEVVVSPMRFGDELLFTSTVRDVDERKDVERAKNEFISTVSHELRTPLTSIRGALGLVLGKAGDSLPAKVRTLLETASRNSERLVLLINDILDLEKLDAGKLDFEFLPLDLTPLIQQAVSANEAYAGQHQVRLRVLELPATAPVRGDDHRLLQVFANLISNAVKYSPAGSTVDIRVHLRDGHWCVGVRDYGRGIPEDFRERIFQRFAQADSSDTRDKGGTGLGLSISKMIIERHDGHIGFDSALDQGTEFYFTLPVYPPASLGAVDATPDAPRLLICEDNAEVAAILADLLYQEGLNSDTVHTGADVRARLDAGHYQGLLLDLTLPDMDGMDLVADLRRTPRFAELPVIIVCGRACDQRTHWSGDALAIIDWLQKPIDRAQLSQALRRALRHGGGTPSILHVEDEPDILQITQALVADLAHYRYATTLADARALLASHHFDLVLLDLTLPDGSGLDLLPGLSVDSQVLVFTGAENGVMLSEKVSAALTKSTTSNDRLLAAIKKLISPPASGSPS